MDCILCGKPIADYQPAFNRLKLDESREVDICPECIRIFMKWQQGIIANLFPTRAVKKRYGKD